MTSILTAVGILAALGLGAGLILAVASAVMAVPRDEKVELLREVLPGVNCGACGYSGCDGYAEAMAHDGAKVGLCSPGGAETAEKTSEILGVKNSGVETITALIRCGGCEEHTTRKLEYRGHPTCAAASQFYGGDLSCSYGCLGYGDCASACEYGAITIENRLARIDRSLCTGCTKCTVACPKALIIMAQDEARGVVRCMNRDKGGVTRKVCSVGCIGCMKCTKVCEYDAIHVNNFLAEIDFEKCVGCGACADNCPVDCITIFGYEPKK
ncbi:MAG: RnfABCDGE type electron transport complex subunit B [Oscillospiraceae bacterium]|nr:RnfABCDGE type electron transport complex subunit B [Oscillospiraceae bacterium]MDD3832631.1 RnfABCDGE type electron transport complex subunit B [Oscillospiraceae bacterium]